MVGDTVTATDRLNHYTEINIKTEVFMGWGIGIGTRGDSLIPNPRFQNAGFHYALSITYSPHAAATSDFNNTTKTMNEPYTKAVKRLIREWKAEAHERELHRELTKLDQEFARWRAGEIGSGELAIIVEACTKGPIHELFSIYNSSFQDNNVAYAVAAGILQRDELPAELVDAIAHKLTHFEKMREQHVLASPEERLQPERQQRRR